MGCFFSLTIYYLQREICADRHDSLRQTLLHILLEAIFTGKSCIPLYLYLKNDMFTNFTWLDDNQERVVERALSFALNPDEQQIFVAYLSDSPHPATKVCLMHYYVAHDCQMQALELNDRIQSDKLEHERSPMIVSQHSKYVISRMCNSLPPLLSNVANRWQLFGDSNPAMSFATNGQKASPRIGQYIYLACACVRTTHIEGWRTQSTHRSSRRQE